MAHRCKCPGTFDGQNCENINQCKNVTFCTGHGTCKDNMCICDDGYYGAHCENFNACEVIRPCKHSSECTPTGDNSYRCECDHGYHGTNCEKFDPCHAQPCFNGGSCVLQDDKMGKRSPVKWVRNVVFNQAQFLFSVNSCISVFPRG